MPNLGAPEIIIVAVLLIVVFGWKRLPDAARSLGRSARVFKSEVKELRSDDDTDAKDTRDDDGPDAGGTRDDVRRTDNTSGPTA